MDLATSYVKEEKLNPNIIAPINQVRLFKKMFLPCELVGLKGNVKTHQFTSLEATSSLKWNINFLKMPKPSKKSFQIWSDFIEWMFQQSIVTGNDFDYLLEWEYQISNDAQFLRNNAPITKYYEKEEIYGRIMYKEVENLSFEEPMRWKNAIATKHDNGRVEIHDVIPFNASPSAIQSPPPFNEAITKSIEESKAYAASDASAKDGVMSGY